MAQRRQQKDVVTRLAEQGEEAFQRIAELIGGVRFVEALNPLRERVDELSRRIRSLDPLEKRVSELERRLDALSKPRATRSTAARKTTTRARSTPRKSGTSRSSGSR
jgi:hypothetical protein